ncbi:MAG: hypothetical protein WA842_01700 [Croceibacterium sp.]
MFEGSSLHTSHAGPPAISGADAHLLRELDWTDLVSRLSAAHEYRASLPDVAASFDADSARWIALHEPQLHGDCDVNPEASGKCKWASATIVPAMHSSANNAFVTRGME